MKKTLLALAIVMTAALSCKKEIPPRMDLLEIQLAGEVSSSLTKSVIESDYSGDLPINFLRKDQTSSGSWGSYGSPLAATKNANGNITFSSTQYYQPRLTNNSTKLVGWHPRTTVSSGKTTIPIDGKTDIMLTNELRGCKDTLFGANATSTHVFKHLLTQIRVKAYAQNSSIKNMWGTISSIKVKGTSTSCIIEFPDKVTFGTSGNLNLITTPVNNDSGTPITHPITLPVTSATAIDCGYAMIAPANASAIKLTVTTSNGGAIDVNVPYALVKGTSYTILLTFTATAIQAKATIEAWATGNYTLTL